MASETVNKSVRKSAAASSGAIVTSLFMTPFDVAKVRLQLASSSRSAVHQMSHFHHHIQIHRCTGAVCPMSCSRGNAVSSINKPAAVIRHLSSSCCSRFCSFRQPPSPPVRLTGTFHALSHILRTEGLTGLFSGLPPTMLIAVPSTMLYLTSYEFLLEDFGQRLPHNSPIGVFLPMLAGSASRIVAATVVSPLELIRTRMQSNNSQKMIRTLTSALETGGYTSLFRGLTATLARDVPFSAIYWTCFEKFKSLLDHHTQIDSAVAKTFLSGCGAGAIAATITTPFDLAKTLQQVEVVDRNKKEKNTLEILRQVVRREGLPGIMTGLSARLVKIVPSCGIMISSYELGKRHLGLQD